MTDLFLSKKSKRLQLLEYIKEKHYVKTHEVIGWGLANYCNDAERLARKLGEEGFIKRVSEEEKNFRFNGSKEDIWEFVHE